MSASLLLVSNNPEAITVTYLNLVCSRRFTRGERVKLYNGKTGGDEGVLGLFSPQFFFPPEFFSRALLSGKAWNRLISISLCIG